MEYETVKHKEKKISVKICKGSIWEELKSSLSDRKYEEKKNDKKKLTVDVNVKREFRSTNETNGKDESWMNRIKSALSRGKYQEPISVDKKDTLNKQPKKEANKTKQSDKKVKEEPKISLEPDKIHEPDLVKEESHNILSQTKKRISGNKNKEQTTINESLKSKKVNKAPLEDENKDKQKVVKSLLAASGDANKDKERPLDDELKISRQKGNKYEVQINNNVEIMNPNELDEEAKETEEQAKRRQITKDKRSKSKPATAKEKWNETVQGKKLDSSNEPTLETIKNLKSSILSLRVVDKKPTKTSNEKEKLREYRNKREEETKKRKKGEDEIKISSEILQSLQGETTKTDLRDVPTEKKKKNHEDVQKVEISAAKENANNKNIILSKKRKDKKEIKDASVCSSNTSVKSDVISEEEDVKNLNKDEKTTKNVKIVNGIQLDERLPIYSSSCYSSSSSSDEHECSCGCMDSNVDRICRELSDSPSSSSSIEYLRSYSGNLIMCAHGKKPVLSEHIRYLSSCIKL